tara:strand:+ start:5491 stop:5778 length:288 start_codon:yes stop_codon:yes gene_type:complete
MNTDFTTIGYYEDFYQNGKFIGTRLCDQQTDRQFGYRGRKKLHTYKSIALQRNKIIKPGYYITSYNRLCGKYIGTQQEKINAIISQNIRQNITKI